MSDLLSPKVIRIIYIAIIVFIILAVMKYLLPALIPFIIALIFSFIMEPITVLLQRKVKLPRGVATFISMIVVFGIIGVAFTMLILKLVAELIHLSVSLPGMATNFSIYFKDLFEEAAAFYVNLPSYITSSLEKNITGVTDNLQNIITGIIDSILQLVSAIPGTVTVLVVSGIATYFLARDRQMIVQLFMRFIPQPWDTKLVEVTREISTAFLGYVRAQAVLITMTTIISVTGLYLVGAKYALTLGLLIGFTDLIPVIGPAAIYLPYIVWSFVTGEIALGIKLSILYALVFVARQIFENRIVSANLGLHPLATLMSMYIGFKLIGFIGLVLGPIILIAVQAVLKAGIFNLKVK